MSEGQDGDTVDLEDARVGFGEELGQELGLDVTDTTLATDLVGQGVGDGVGDGLGVGRVSIGGLRNNKGEDVLNKDVVGCDLVVDLDAYLEERSLCEGCGATDTVVILADIGRHGVVELDVGFLGSGRSTLGRDSSESEVGLEVNGDCDICLVKLMDSAGSTPTVPSM